MDNNFNGTYPQEQPEQQGYQQNYQQAEQQGYQQEQNNYQQTYQQEYQQTYQQAPQFQPTNQYQPQMGGYQPYMEEPVSVGDWIGSQLLLLIPCVNIILILVWAFSSSTKKSKSNYFKAYLIIYLVGLVLGIILLVVFGSSLAALMGSAGYYY